MLRCLSDRQVTCSCFFSVAICLTVLFRCTDGGIDYVSGQATEQIRLLRDVLRNQFLTSRRHGIFWLKSQWCQQWRLSMLGATMFKSWSQSKIFFQKVFYRFAAICCVEIVHVFNFTKRDCVVWLVTLSLAKLLLGIASSSNFPRKSLQFWLRGPFHIFAANFFSKEISIWINIFAVKS